MSNFDECGLKVCYSFTIYLGPSTKIFSSDKTCRLISRQRYRPQFSKCLAMCITKAARNFIGLVTFIPCTVIYCKILKTIMLARIQASSNNTVRISLLSSLVTCTCNTEVTTYFNQVSSKLFIFVVSTATRTPDAYVTST